MQCGGSAGVPRSVEWTYLLYHDDDGVDGVVSDFSGDSSGGWDLNFLHLLNIIYLFIVFYFTHNM